MIEGLAAAAAVEDIGSMEELLLGRKGSGLQREEEDEGFLRIMPWAGGISLVGVCESSP